MTDIILKIFPLILLKDTRVNPPYRLYYQGNIRTLESIPGIELSLPSIFGKFCVFNFPSVNVWWTALKLLKWYKCSKNTSLLIQSLLYIPGFLKTGLAINVYLSHRLVI